MEKVSKRRKQQINYVCEDCDNCVACGEGDFICMAGDEKVLIMDYIPADDYMWCGGKKFEQ